MKGKLVLVGMTVIAIAALGFGVMAQSEDSLFSEDQLKAFAKSASDAPDTDSPNWKVISEDVGLMLGRADKGVVRARLYVRSGYRWIPVAVDGFSELAPSSIPLHN